MEGGNGERAMAGGGENYGHTDWSGRGTSAIWLFSPTMSVLKEKQEEASEFNYSETHPGTLQSSQQGTEMLHAL